MDARLLFVSVVVISILLAPSLGMQQNCNKGTFFDGAKCQLCPPGTYQNKRAEKSCKPCPAGYFNRFRGLQGIDLCEPCTEGTFNPRTGATSSAACRPCAAGKNSALASSRCLSCRKGKYISKCDDPGAIPTFPGTFGACVNSQFELTPFVHKCRTCFADTFTSTNTALECTDCPTGKIALPGSERCKICPPGSGINGGVRNCRPCLRSTINDGSTGWCSYCPPGFIGNSPVNATRCVPCPRGTAKPGIAQRKCRQCQPGENSRVTGATFCMPDNTPCPSNFFHNFRGACERCTKQQRLNKTKKRCVACRKNEESKGGLARRCTRCPRGTVASEEGCTCIEGWALKNGRCRPCPAGSFSEFGGTDICTECSVGEIAPRPGMKKCVPCPDGMVQPLAGQSRCMSCPKRLRADFAPTRHRCVDPATGCLPSESRSVDNRGINFCMADTCPDPDTFKLESGTGRFFSSNCISCSTFDRFDPTKKECIFCGNRRGSLGGTSTRCTIKCKDEEIFRDGRCQCVDGRGVVSGKCKRCAPGTFGAGFSGSGCTPCPPGTFQPATGKSECRTCRAGSFSRGGAATCAACPNGTVSFGVGDANCVRPGSLNK